MDRGAWRAMVHALTESDRPKRLKQQVGEGARGLLAGVEIHFRTMTSLRFWMFQHNNGPRVVVGATVILFLNLHVRWLLHKRKEQYPFFLPVIKYQTHQRSEAEASLGWAAYNEQNSTRSQGQRVTVLRKGSEKADLLSVLSFWKDSNPASLVAQMVKNLPAIWVTWIYFLGREDPLEKGMATHSSILAWGIPWTEQPGGQQSMGSQRVRHD